MQQRFGPYELLELIARGASGDVYRARDTSLDAEAAVKLIWSASPGDRKTAALFNRFSRSEAAFARLNHPGIVTVYDVGFADGIGFVATELLHGRTLRAELEHGALSEALAVRYALQLSDALSSAHQVGVVHGDLRPEHVFVTHGGRVKILDFGLAKCRDEALELVQADGSPAAAAEPHCSIGYLSPEQVRGEASDERTDIFSLGALLYEMVSGRPAFRSDSVVATLTAVLNDEPQMLRSTDGMVSPLLARVIRRCLQKDAGSRFGSARELFLSLKEATRWTPRQGAQRESTARRMPPAVVSDWSQSYCVGRSSPRWECSIR